MTHPFRVVSDFERAVAEYTGAPFCVAVNSCTAALLLAVARHMEDRHWHCKLCGWRPVVGQTHQCDRMPCGWQDITGKHVEIPKHTYVSVPMSIIHAGGRPTFRDEDWIGAYQLRPLPVWDSARWFSTDLYRALGQGLAGAMVCVSFHASKTLGISQGGAILHDSPEADAWLRRARFDGRSEGVAPKEDHFEQLGWHCYLSPDVAAGLLLKLHSLPKHNPPLKNDDYPDLSELPIFRGGA